MGALPRQLQQNDYNAQYQEFLRQTGQYKDQFRYPDQLALEQLHAGYPGSSNPNYGNSTADQLLPILAMLLGGGGGSGGSGGTSGLLAALNRLLSGGSGSPGQNATGDQAPGGPNGGAGNPNQYPQPIGPNYPSDYNPDTGGYYQYQDPIGPQLPPDTGSGYDPNAYDPGVYDWPQSP